MYCSLTRALCYICAHNVDRVNTYFDNYTYTDAGANVGENVHFGANRRADHSNYTVAENSFPQGLAYGATAIPATSQHHDFHIQQF